MRLLTFLLLTSLFFTCSPDSPDEAATSSIVNKTSAPAPGVTPQPTVEIEGDLAATALTGAAASDCSCTLQLDGSDESFFNFDWKGDAGTIGLNGHTINLRRGASLSVGGQSVDSYLHENDQFRVQTRLQKEGDDSAGGGTYSGSVKVTDKLNGAKMKATVVGSCAC